MMVIKVLPRCNCCLKTFAASDLNDMNECQKCHDEAKEFMEQWRNQEPDEMGDYDGRYILSEGF